MKTKRLLFISCLAAGALIASPSFGKPAKKSAGMSQSKAKRVAPHTTQVMRNDRHNQNISPRTGSTRYYGGTRYSGTRSYAARQYSRDALLRRHTLLRQLLWGRHPLLLWRWILPVLRLLFGLAVLELGLRHILGILPVLVLWGGYPYSGYNNYYSYYTPTYGYNASMVAAVQRRLGQLGYYHGVVDGVIGPQTRGAIAAFESRNGLAVDGTISRPLLDTLGLA